MSFEATTTTAALPTPNTEVAFGSLSNTHNYFDAYVDFLANLGSQKIQLRIYATSAAGGVRALVAQSDWLSVGNLVTNQPVRAIAGLKGAVGTLFELQLISDGVCGNVKASLVGYESQQNVIPPETSTATTAIALTETVMATLSNPHAFFDASADYLNALNCKVRWSLYATAGVGGVRAKVAQFDMPAAVFANQKQIVLESIGPIGANTIELVSQALEPIPASPNIKASLDGFEPLCNIPSTITTEDNWIPGIQNTYGKKVSISTTDATATTLESYALPDNTVTSVYVTVSAIELTGGGSPDAAEFQLKAVYARFGGAAPTVVKAPTVVDSNPNANGAAWTAVIDNSGNNARIRVTGAAGKNISWSATRITYEGI